MCIIVVKPKGINLPELNTLRNCFNNNPDGAGFAIQAENSIIYSKGYQAVSHLYDDLVTANKEYPDAAMLIHFRIATSGGITAENCHPFPVTDDISRLHALHGRTHLAIAHNGIIDIRSTATNSDTVEFIRNELAYLDKAVPEWYNDQNILKALNNRIQSKLAVLPVHGQPVMIGTFIEDNGLYFSNSTYLHSLKFRGWPVTEIVELMPIYTGYYVDDFGEMFEIEPTQQERYFIDDRDTLIYEYNGYYYACESYQAYNNANFPQKFEHHDNNILVDSSDIEYLADIYGY